MKRVDILYAGSHYSVGQEDLEALKREILNATRDGQPRWLTVNHGEGRPQKAEILIGPGIPIALMPVRAPESEHSDDEHANGNGRDHYDDFDTATHTDG